MLHASTRKLIDRLSEMTELGKLDWAESEDGTIAYATEGYSVALTESPNEVIITSKDGKELERATADELAATHHEDGAAYTAIVAAMTMEASRVARGTEAAISSLLAGMQDSPDAAASELAPTDADADVADDLQEDPVNESTAIAIEPVESTDTTTELETSADPEPEPEIDAAEIDETEDDAAQSDSAMPFISTADTEATVSDETNAIDEADTSIAVDAEMPAEIDTAAEVTAEDAPEETGETETESDVTEAVARLADEVNQREGTDRNTGLDAAAASAAGAVAVAAGLAVQPASEQDEPSAAATESDDTAEMVAAVETSPAPAYIPFGLEPEAEDGAETVVVADPRLEEPAEPVEVETEPETPAPAPLSSVAFMPGVEATTAVAQPIWSSSAAETESEPEAEPDAEVVQEQTEESTPEPAFTAAAPLDSAPKSEFEQPAETPAETEDTIADTPAEFAASASSEEAGDVPAAPKTPEPAAPVADPKPPTTYSLSGIGAGFGLGALSAKTEASGIPGPNSSNAPTQEKVIIDATDDVLPELEGNLNVSLAETASAAVGAANAEAAPSEPADTKAAEAETDILKPRTRFNPWD